MDQKPKKGYPAYDDDKFYDVESVISYNDCTGLVPTPPQTESEAESYADLLNIPQPKEKSDSGLSETRPDKQPKSTGPITSDAPTNAGRNCP